MAFPQADELAATVSADPAAPLYAGPVVVAPSGAQLDATATADRYEPLGTLGAGGMGEVRLVRDRTIEREIAVKVLRPELAHLPGSVERFLREARVQGQLDHPNVVPVYDLAAEPDGTIYFTMRRIRGVTLARVFEGLASGDPAMREKHTRRRLLTAFCTVCLAVDFAHQRGVAHRDMKPENVMLGDFGEVYVLDWGVAKILSDRDAPEAVQATETVGQTRAGAIVGTPAYMAPEQAQGIQEVVGAPADVYALGAILFEMLTLEPLNPGKTAAAVFAAALVGGDARASIRAPDADVPPELEDACVRATAADPHARLDSARKLCALVERYLEGDRDVERRRELAARHAAAAREHAALAARPGPEGREARAAAIRDVAQALALHPEDRNAAAILLSLLVAPPVDTPPEVARQLEGAQQSELQLGARMAFLANGIWLLFVPLAIAMGVRGWGPGAVCIGLIVISVLVCAYSLRVRHIAPWLVGVAVAANSATIGSFAMLFGPLFFVTPIALANLVFYTLVGGLRSRRWLLVLAGVAPILVPWLLERAGVLAPAYAFTDSGLLLHPRLVVFHEAPTTAFLLLTALAVVPASVLMAERFRTVLAKSQRDQLLQLWQLQQLVPPEVREKDLRETGSAGAPKEGSKASASWR